MSELGLIEKLAKEHALGLEGYEELLALRTAEGARRLAELADAARREIYGNAVYIRALIEISNICRNDCLYCGIRRSNARCRRYRLSEEDILACCRKGAALGFRTFVLQGGEDGYYTDERLCALIRAIKREHPDCTVTLSLGERSRESYAQLKNAGADRYLLRHETADASHYALLHPAQMLYANRMRCLSDLKALGYQVGCGFMVGSPYQTNAHLAKDLRFIEAFRPEMVGIGPFIPQRDTPFAGRTAGTVELTCYLLSVIRLILPGVLLPSTTALATIDPCGRERGILAGANVVMPNLSPAEAKDNYTLYDHKVTDGAEDANSRKLLETRMHAIGFEVVTGRGDAALRG